MRKRIVLLILASLIIIVYFAILPYYESREIERCRNQPCPVDLQKLWDVVGCVDSVEGSLAYQVHIHNNANGSVSDFDCQMGPRYSSPKRNFAYLACDRQTAEQIDLAVKGRNSTNEVDLLLKFSYPDFNDYTLTILSCRTNKDRYPVIFFVNRSGVLYP